MLLFFLMKVYLKIGGSAVEIRVYSPSVMVRGCTRIVALLIPGGGGAAAVGLCQWHGRADSTRETVCRSLRSQLLPLPPSVLSLSLRRAMLLAPVF